MVGQSATRQGLVRKGYQDLVSIQAPKGNVKSGSFFNPFHANKYHYCYLNIWCIIINFKGSMNIPQHSYRYKTCKFFPNSCILERENWKLIYSEWLMSWNTVYQCKMEPLHVSRCIHTQKIPFNFKCFHFHKLKITSQTPKSNYN